MGSVSQQQAYASRTTNLGGRPAFNPTAAQRRAVGLYRAEGLFNVEIAAILGISCDTLRKHFNVELGISRGATRCERVTARECGRCGVDITGYHGLAKYCSACRAPAVNQRDCKACGIDITATHGRTRYCSSECRKSVRPCNPRRYPRNFYPRNNYTPEKAFEQRIKYALRREERLAARASVFVCAECQGPWKGEFFRIRYCSSICDERARHEQRRSRDKARYDRINQDPVAKQKYREQGSLRSKAWRKANPDRFYASRAKRKAEESEIISMLRRKGFLPALPLSRQERGLPPRIRSESEKKRNKATLRRYQNDSARRRKVAVAAFRLLLKEVQHANSSS